MLDGQRFTLLQDIFQGVIYLVQSQPQWIQVLLGIIMSAQVFMLLDLVGGILMTPQMSWGERFKSLAMGVGVFVGGSLFLLLCFLPLLIMQFKFIEWLLPILLPLLALNIVCWCYQQWRSRS